jgi:hypothetical protein
MLTFIKRLLGLTPNPVKTAEEVKAIFVPAQVEPSKQWTIVNVDLSKATPKVTKVRAITDTKPNAVKEAITPKPGNKRHRSRNRNKVKAGITVTKINQPTSAVTEGKTKGGNGAVKPAQVAKAKPAKPKAPVKK